VWARKAETQIVTNLGEDRVVTEVGLPRGFDDDARFVFVGSLERAGFDDFDRHPIAAGDEIA
jgi:hypothetical protein